MDSQWYTVPKTNFVKSNTILSLLCLVVDIQSESRKFMSVPWLGNREVSVANQERRYAHFVQYTRRENKARRIYAGAKEVQCMAYTRGA